MNKTRIVVAAIAIIAGLIGTAANAREVKTDVPVEKMIKRHTKICAEEPPMTGTITTKMICKTAARWQVDGVNPADLLAARR